MPLDGVTVNCLAGELNACLPESRVDRVFQPDRHDIILQLYKNARSSRLVLSADPAAPRVHLTSETRGNPTEAPMFCMLLRKYLIGARILDVAAPDFERMIRIRFDVVNEMGDHVVKSLLIEMMGKHSNIIFLNQDDRIHDAILHIDASVNRIREILPARPYVSPPGQNKLTPKAALDLLRGHGILFGPAARLLSLDKALLETLQGFSPLLCQEIITLADLEPAQKLSGLDHASSARLSQVLESFLSEIDAGCYTPTLFYDRGEATPPVDFHALKLHAYAVQKPAGSLLQAMDCFYLEKTRQNAFAQKRQNLSRIVNGQLDHARKKMAIHTSDMREGEAFEQHKRMGDLILSNLQEIRSETGTASVTDFFSPDQPQVRIPLQINLSASQNAQRYYKLYGKAKAKYAYASRLIAEDMRDITYLESLVQALSAASETDDLLAVRQEIDQTGFIGGKQAGLRKSADEKKPKSVKGQARPSPLLPRRYASTDGFTILAGRNNLQNDQLTLKMAQKSDIWLHVQHIPGTHVIIQANRQAVPERTIREAAEIAAWFSRASLALPSGQPGSDGPKTAVDYCPVSHVRKPAGARPGMVIYEHYQTVIVTPKEPKAPEQSYP
jgi:predicted ribosome quality control (RQC) complex YloA/Tae2 family protein